MANMTTAQKNAAIKSNAVGAIVLPENAIQVGDYTYAIPVTVDGELRYAEITVTAKNNKDTKTTVAYDPEDKRAEWLADKDEKAKEAERKAAEKAEKLAKKAASKK